jgi:hypothetical protein
VESRSLLSSLLRFRSSGGIITDTATQLQQWRLILHGFSLPGGQLSFDHFVLGIKYPIKSGAARRNAPARSDLPVRLQAYPRLILGLAEIAPWE